MQKPEGSPFRVPVYQQQLNEQNKIPEPSTTELHQERHILMSNKSVTATRECFVKT